MGSNPTGPVSSGERDTRDVCGEERPRDDPASSGHLRAKERGLRRDPTCPHLTLDFQAPGLSENKLLWVKPHSLGYFAMAVQADEHSPLERESTILRFPAHKFSTENAWAPQTMPMGGMRTVRGGPGDWSGGSCRLRARDSDSNPGSSAYLLSPGPRVAGLKGVIIASAS